MLPPSPESPATARVGLGLLAALLLSSADAQVAAPPAAGTATSAPGAPAPVRPDDDGAARRQIDQKLQLAERMVSDSASVQRIQASGNTQAQTHYEEARVHLAAAQDALGRADLAAARRSADDALRHIGQARRLAPDAPSRLAAARQRHEQLRASLERLHQAWRERVASQGASAGDAAVRDSERHTVTQGLMARAAQLADERRYDEASALLTQAERHVLEGMNSLLQANTTLDYSLRPSSPAEALEQELARQRSLADLVPLALADLKPRAEAVALIERYSETAATLRAQALQQQQAGETAQALVLVRNATLYVQRALQAAGLVAPLATGDPP
ncbi:MAG: hypothetical protein RIQ60_3818 [Pseudomonadota bacterium]|jgi:hypothetical protein